MLKLSCMTRSMARAGLLVACHAAAPAASEEEELAAVFGDKASISIATGSRQPLRRAPAVATVITAEDIAAMGATELSQVLESVPGMHVGVNNQAYNPLFLIRGIYSEFNPQTLMLQNGVPMSTLFVGNRGLQWVGLPVENIARIEIIRGPGSALYGADAFSGVINIITKSARDVPGLELGARLGSYSARDAWSQYGGTLGPIQVAAYLRAGRTDGIDRIVEADGQTGLDKLFGTAISLAPGKLNNQADLLDASLVAQWETWQLHASYKLRDKLGSGAGVASALDLVSRGRSERFVADLSRNDMALGAGWKLGLSASFMYFTQAFPVPLQLFPPGAFGGAFPNGMIGAPETWERQTRLSAVATYDGLAGNLLRIGAGHDDLDLYRTRELKNFSVLQSGPFVGLPVPNASGRVEEVLPGDSFLVPHRRRLSYAYVQDEWSFRPDWTLTAGVRHDRYSDVGSTTNPRVALVWDSRLDLTTKLLYGRAFRAPSFTEQYSINNPVIRGNNALKPERIETLEAALAWQAGTDLQLNLSLYRYNMRDGIRTTQAADGSAQFNNIGRQHGRGLELEAQWQASRRWRFSGHYAWQRSIDEASGQDAGYAPHQHLWLQVDGQLGAGWQGGAQLNRVAGRHRAPGELRPPIADYTTLDLNLRHVGARPGWEFALAVRNLFNADVREPSLAPGQSLPNDLPLARRNLSLQAVYRL